MALGRLASLPAVEQKFGYDPVPEKQEFGVRD